MEEIIVTASKRAGSLQNVPISIQALSTARLEQLQITSFNDYAKYLPSVSFQSIGPGTAKVYFRGVATGGDGNHSGPLPSVGIYLLRKSAAGRRRANLPRRLCAAHDRG